MGAGLKTKRVDGPAPIIFFFLSLFFLIFLTSMVHQVPPVIKAQVQRGPNSVRYGAWGNLGGLPAPLLS